MRFYLRVMILLSVCLGLQAGKPRRWPTIAPKIQTFVLKDSGPRYLRTRVCGSRGNALYLFHAYLNAEEFYSRALEIQSGFPQGDLECRLESIAEEQQGDWEPTILFNKEANPKNDWSHRGIFWIDQFEKEPSSSLWGLTRSFHFRGMTVTIRILDYALAGPAEIPYWAKNDRKRFKSVTIEIEAVPNPKAFNAFDPRQ